MLPPLDAPHHLRRHEWGPYREGRLLYCFSQLTLYVPVTTLLGAAP